MLRFVSPFLLLFFFAFSLQAQITGQVKDELNKQELAFASVSLYDKNKKEIVAGTLADAEGRFAIQYGKKGNYILQVSFLGYNTLQMEEGLNAYTGQALGLGTVYLQASQALLDEIEVVGQKAVFYQKPDRQVYEASTLRNAQGGNAIDALKGLPGVSVDGSGTVSVRGTTGFVLMINGRPVQGDVQTYLQQIPANAVDKMEFITTPSAKYDPEGKAGILNIQLKKNYEPGSFTQVNVKLGLPSVQNYNNAQYAQRYGADLIYNYQKGKWNFSAGGNYYRNDLAGRREGDVYTIIDGKKTVFPSDGARSFDEETYSGRVGLDFTPNENNSLSFGLFAGKRQKDRLADITYFDNHGIDLAQPNERLYTFQYFNHNLRTRLGNFALGSLDYTHRFKGGGRWSNSFLYEYTLLGGPTINQNLPPIWASHTGTYQDEYNTNDNPLHGIRFQSDYVFKPSKLGTWSAGYQYRHLNHVGDFVYERKNSETDAFELVPEFSSEVDLKRQIHSVYGNLDGKVNKWAYSLGLRVEQMNRDLHLKDKTGLLDTLYSYDFLKFYPSAQLTWNLPKEQKLKLAYSRRVERTTTFKMNPFPEREHSETLEQGDPTLKPEFIDAVELSYSKNFKSGDAFFSNAYFRNTQNLVNRVNTVFNDTILNRIYSNVGVGRAVGIELGGQFKPNKNWSNFVGFNLYHYQIDGSFAQMPVHTGSWVYAINANSTYNLPRNWTLQFSLNYLSKRVTAQGEDSQFYSPNLSLSKSFMQKRLKATLQWLNMDMGLLGTNEQRITTWRKGSFYTTTNYVYEVDMLILNLSYTFNERKSKAKFIKSEFGEREF
ncbi:TonB-dependent receptor [Marinilongibacter aquaticus]|uniref:outer membrane beta-barrel protein n=1 Tax=Marinilongibacter aquaticus TaxID=2975157 RepID=UPI0021BD8129|nr:outer membrane beta-barrel protein [Marinilongibacter aquaticus]UBM60192.1 TonB-dependent receptor [Marinilongibacter aquaticus]